MEYQELVRRVGELERELRELKSASGINHNTEQAIRTRFRLDRLDNVASLDNSDKSSSSENVTVNEAGSGTHSVLKAPDAFLEVEIEGGTKYIPIYT